MRIHASIIIPMMIAENRMSFSPGARGGTWPTNIRGRGARKSIKLPSPGVKFPKMIPCLGVKFS